MTLCNENAPLLVNEEMGCNIWLMTVRAPEIATTARPGQFVHVKVPGMEAHILRRPFGVYAADAEAGTVDMMYQVLGFGTEHMTELAAGDAVEMIGPIGRGWQPPEGCKRALIVAGGVGSAPLYPLAEELTAAGICPPDAHPRRLHHRCVGGPPSATGPCSGASLPAPPTTVPTAAPASARRLWKRPWRRPLRKARPTTTWPAAARSPS